VGDALTNGDLSRDERLPGRRRTELGILQFEGRSDSAAVPNLGQAQIFIG
jgi:hypothetical protein